MDLSYLRDHGGIQPELINFIYNTKGINLPVGILKGIYSHTIPEQIKEKVRIIRGNGKDNLNGYIREI